MSEKSVPLTPAERAALLTSLTGIRDRLDRAKEAMVAIYVNQAVERLAPEPLAIDESLPSHAAETDP